MKIALLIEAFNPEGGGMERSTSQIAQELIARGHEVTVLTAWRPSLAEEVGLLTPDRPVQIGAIRVIAQGRRTPKSAWRLWRFSRWVRRQLAAGGYDVSLSMTTAAAATVLQPRGGTVRETQARNIAMRHSGLGRAVKRGLLALSPKKQTLCWLERRTLRDPLVQRIVAVSRYVSRQLQEHYNFDPSRIDLIPNAAQMPQVDAAQRQRWRKTVREGLSVPEGAVVYVFAALNPRLKGVVPLLQAFQQLQRRGGPGGGAVLLLAGKNEYAQQHLAADLGIRAQVRFVGPTNQMAMLYAAADVTVLPTYYDPASKVVIESLMMGVPAISTSYNGASDFLVGEDGAWRGRVVAEPDDVPALAQAMWELADADERNRCAAATQGLAEELSMRRHVDRLEAVLKRVQPPSQAIKATSHQAIKGCGRGAAM